MIAAWMLHAIVVGAFAALAALACEWGCRALGRPTRWAWAAAMALTVVLVALAPLRGHEDVIVMAVSPAGVDAAATTPDTAVARTLAGRVAAALDELRAHLRAPVPHAAMVLARWVRTPQLATIGSWLAGTWAIASLLLLATTLVAARRLARARRAWPVVALHGEPVRVAPGAGPAVVGLARAAIVVPRWLLGRPAAEQRVVLAHEREHLRARDPLLLALGSLVTIALPWHPLAWWMQGRLRLAVELDCDARVLRSGVAPGQYGALLLDVAALGQRGTSTRLGFPALGVPALAPRARHLERRLVAMTSPRPRHPRVRLALAHLLACAAILAACESRLPTSAELERMDVATVERSLDIGADSATTYWIDDLKVSAAEAHAVAPNRIVSVLVSKQPQGVGSREIRITTANGAATPDAPGAPPAPPVAQPAGPLRIEVDSTRERHFEGLVVIDGVRSTSSALHRLGPSRIATVDVIKGARGQQLYPGDTLAARGVIKVTTKAP